VLSGKEGKFHSYSLAFAKNGSQDYAWSRIVRSSYRSLLFDYYRYSYHNKKTFEKALRIDVMVQRVV